MRLLSFQLKLELLWFVASFCMQHAWLDRLKALTQMHRATQAHRDTLAHTQGHWVKTIMLAGQPAMTLRKSPRRNRNHYTRNPASNSHKDVQRRGRGGGGGGLNCRKCNYLEAVADYTTLHHADHASLPRTSWRAGAGWVRLQANCRI